MTHPGWLGGFPGDWTYHGDAKLLIGDAVQPITISLRLIFVEQADIDVKLIWKGITDDKRLKTAVKIQEEKQQLLVIQGSIFLIGYSRPPFDTNNGITNFYVARFITYSGLPKNCFTEEQPDYFIQLRAYLNDEFSSMDEIFATEFENMPQRRDRNLSTKIAHPSLYCALNSGYEVKCGKKFITHKDHDVVYKRNIDTLYKFSFIDISIPLRNKHLIKLIIDGTKEIEVSLVRHLEQVLNDTCAFLSIICDYEIIPIYYDYSMFYKQKYISGRIIPIWERRRIPRTSKSWPTQGIHFLGNITSFLECCPLSKQLSRGIEHLKITVYESTVELKLMAACSAIEYFYSYWFWEMNGLSKLISAVSQNNQLVDLNQASFSKLKKLNSQSSSKTPYLSTVIRFFIDDLGIDWKKYMGNKATPQFIQVRNELLHGSFTSDDIKIFEAEEVAQKLGTEILFSIMKNISKLNDSEEYESLPIRTPEKDFYKFSDGWNEIRDVLDELHTDKKNKQFWNQE
ncbi:hypothetical protein NIES2119_24085 [[Phormidium ambiguum] IAM M-71]|uniref:Apea-like HEPN domain-containing protein n=1 Tax=[Phormidium ambiguum] IAM M-71 TaxID=454136 RepID=A0A1U7I9E0_9CYAN|nr:hypothetical protein [Phormidium ambiguum]OKH33145.1 hypothetical protein NIES2119_24085 [Phormidium ambiguum IAM M-71]